MKKTLKLLLSLALISGISLFSLTPAQAIPLDYNVTGGMTGTFNADLSVGGGVFNSWTLTTPTATFTDTDGGVVFNTNFALFQIVSPNAFSFILPLSPLNSLTYTGSFSGGVGSASGTLSGSFVQAQSVPEAGTYLLLFAGLGMVYLAARQRKAAWF